MFILLLIVSLINFIYIISQLILPFKTHNPLITNDQYTLELIKNSSDEIIVKTLLNNLIYVTIDIGKLNQKIEFFLNMKEYEFFLNIQEENFNSENKNFFPDLQYNNYILLKHILNFSYYNISLCESSFSGHLFEKVNIINETMNIIIMDNITKKEEEKEIRMFIPYKDSIKYDHRPAVLGLYLGNSFMLNLKGKIAIKPYNWIIKYSNFHKEEGKLIIGGLPHEYDNQNYKEENLRVSNVYIEENMHPEWRLKFIKSFIISKKNNTLNEYKINENNIACFNIEEFFILGSDDYFHIIQKLFFQDYINKGICQKQTHKKSQYVKDYFHFMCFFNGNKNEINTFFNNFPIPKFYQNDMDYNFTLNATDLFTIIPDNNRILFNVEFLENYNNWVFGKPFFKKYQLIFDDERKIIKYYIEKENENENINTQKDNKTFIYIIIIIFLIIIFFILGFLSSKYIFNKCNKKNQALELNDEYLINSKNDD